MVLSVFMNQKVGAVAAMREKKGGMRRKAKVHERNIEMEGRWKMKWEVLENFSWAMLLVPAINLPIYVRKAYNMFMKIQALI